MSAIPDRAGYALVTGGGARLGAAMVRRLAADGWAVAIHYHHSAKDADALAQEIKAGGGRAVTLGCDLAEPEDFADLFGRANAGWGFCSLLVNSASAFEYDDISNITRANLERLFAVNLHAPVLLARDFAAQLREGARGLIVNVLDQKVFNLNPDFLSYTMTKSALEAATRLLAQAMAPRIRVCGLAPGLTLRSGEQSEEGFAAAHAKTPLGFGSKPEDIAEALSFLVKVPSITGTTVIVDGGQHLQPRTHDVMFTYGISPDAPVGKPS
ncbi:MAG TPA: SDR family oxidoreductase [Rhizomicrobium sp.]|jgi:NAD(P)-dependent dehydrogenase (short-subunit alcohol dehydrogenase family)|nr:SDR family oxidoreductase [Rhizomicrobium sp.]